MQQILPYLQPGARVLDTDQDADPGLSSLAIRTADGAPAVFLINQDFNPLELTLTLAGTEADRYGSLVLTRTDRDHKAERLGRVRLQDGVGQLMLPARSITTLFPAGAGPAIA